MKKRHITIFFGVVALILSFQLRLPYYITSPGITEDLTGLVEVAGAETEKEYGNFSLVTIKMGTASFFDLIKAKFSKYEHIYKSEQILAEDETNEEFSVRQMEYMNTAKLGAIITAYTKAAQPIEIHYDGLYVLRTVKGLPAEKVIQPGDRVVSIDGEQLVRSDQYKAIFAQKEIGETAEIVIIRDEAEKTVQVEMAQLENANPGIGIAIVESKRVETEPKVEIDSEEIGGPSAGLMFALEIYNQLAEGDLTKGYQIAGTGSIDENGEVGSIGGVDQKVVAADRDGFSVFFAPVADGNAEEAEATAKEIGTKMKIVPVKNFDEAVAYLETLAS